MSVRHVTVVGAGIVGTCCALRLRLDGYAVTLIDEREPGTATSFGNAGIISTGSIMPYATPGLWKAAPGMLLDPLSPLMLSWRYLPRAAPWLLRYLAEGRTSRAHAVAAEMAPLTTAAYEAHRDLMASGDIEQELIRQDGYLHVWREADGFEQAALQRSLMAEHGIACEVLDGDGIAALEPGLARDF
ncbi:MAG: FAD-dependent oxidoreductase, partial [Alphaproteobacteria bacterium]|nr:FAD-dependent oxidoreductase [Alphaproteobacteria bacterium]